MTPQTRRWIPARPLTARGAATPRACPRCPAWSGAPPAAAQFHINPLVTASAARASSAACIQEDEDDDNGDHREKPGHYEPTGSGPRSDPGSRAFAMVCGHKITPQ